MKSFASVIALLLLASVEIAARGAPTEVPPLLNAHAHNDYEHTHPLFDALDQGFTSVEADVYPVDGELLVGHNRRDLKPERTLESLYLAPLAERIKKNDGHVYPQASRFFLLIDIKSDPPETYRLLQSQLAKYRQMFTTIADGKTHSGAITAVLTGDRPKLDSDDRAERFVGLDGHVSELSPTVPANFMPMISDSWSSQFHWNGTGEMPAAEREKLRHIADQAHAQGRVLRFWATPENENFWREIRSDGVDLLNTDQLARAATFLRANEKSPPSP